MVDRGGGWRGDWCFGRGDCPGNLDSPQIGCFEGLLQSIHDAAYRVARVFTRAEQQPPANSSATFPMGLVGEDPFPRVPHYLTDDMRVEMEARRQQLQHLYEQGCQGNRAAWV